MLNYVQTGNKASLKTLLFIHGSGCNHKIFGEVYKYLTDYNCIVIDLNGHGDSKGECSPTVEGYIANVVDFIKNSEVTKNEKDITIIGYSMGGGIVLGMALKKLPNIKKVIVLSGSDKFKFNEDFMKKIRRNELDQDYMLQCCGSEPNPLIPKYCEMMEQDPKIMANDLIACENFDISNEIKNINIPVKIIIARDEILVLLKWSECINSKIKNSILTIFERGRHFLLVVRGKEVAAEISSFVSD